MIVTHLEKTEIVKKKKGVRIKVYISSDNGGLNLKNWLTTLNGYTREKKPRDENLYEKLI